MCVADLDPVSEHERSIRHRVDVFASDELGCFSCLATYPPSEVVDWADVDAAGLGQTAICPRCFVDAVIPVRPGIDDQFLAAMNRQWF